MKPLRKQENVWVQVQDWLEDEIYGIIWNNIKYKPRLQIFDINFYEITEQIWSAMDENT